MSEAHAGLADVMAQQIAHERERALRALLMQPLMSSQHEDFVLVRRHGEYLRDWLARETGWILRIERDCARLYKLTASIGDATRGAPDFSRERYVLFCLVCSVLERAEVQITLRALGERLLEAAADPELAERGFTCTLESARERRDLVSVCRYLLGLGVLGRVAGDEESYVSQSGDVLYDIHRRILAALPASTRGASFIAATSPDADFEARLSKLIEEYVPDSDEGRRTALRHRLARRLLDDPVIYRDETNDAEREYLATQRGPMSGRLARASGLSVELRAEGMALIDPDGDMSDEQLPATGTQAHATLLIAEHLAAALRESPQRICSTAEIEHFLRAASEEHGRYWRKSAREPGAETELVAQALVSLEALQLVRRIEGGVRGRPALLRYAVGGVNLRSQESLL